MASKIEIAEAIVPIVPSAKGIKGGIEKELSGELGSAGEAGGKLLGGNLVKALTGVIAAAGIGKFIQGALSEGGKLQQSYGGLQTIYGEAADAAQKYAEQAYKAGLSANDYAEQAVSFGASLKQAFSGDTTKAVEAANTAIMDMTDNAAKMGTPIESIQHAYQGFAKQNYTMLDNLKLGYGGTKTEMERLLADAQALTGVEYDISNLGDVYEAIHVIQGELGLTGVAAAEAEGTFTGSMGAMQAALSNFMGQLATGGDIVPALKAVIGNAAVFLQNNLIPMVGNIISAIPTVIQTAAPLLIQSVQNIATSIAQKLPEMFNSMLPLAQQGAQNMLTSLTGLLTSGSIESGIQTVTNLVQGLLKGIPNVITAGGTILTNFINAVGQKLPGVIQKAGELVKGFLDTILKELPQIFNTGAEVVSKVAEGLASNIPRVVEAAGQAIAQFLSTILSNLPQIVSSGINLLTKFAEGINQNANALIYSAANAIKTIVSTIVQHLPEILESGAKIIAFLLSGIARQVPNVLTAIGALIADIVRAFANADWGQIGHDIITGIVNGLKSAGGILWEAAKNSAKEAYEAAKDFLKIGSPSKLFRDEVGAMMAEGMAIGFEENVPTAEIEQSLMPMESVVPNAMGGQYSYGGFTINVYGAPGQDINALADIIGDRINSSIKQRQAVFA